VRVLTLHSRPDQTVFGMANRLLTLDGRG
jgi:hypothetical protein